MKPLILLTTGYYRAPNDRLRRILWQSYADAVERAGGMTALITGEDAARWAELGDGLLLTGGVDIEPHRYGEKSGPACGETDPLRDRDELSLFSAFCRAKKPVLGICRGIQIINVALGGTVFQDLPSQMGAEGHADGAVHPVTAAGGGWLEGLFGRNFEVNSYHHQAVRELGEGLRADASAPDGVVEAAVHETLPVWAVQWHPERMTGPERLAPPSCAEMAPLFEDFLSRCKA